MRNRRGPVFYAFSDLTRYLTTPVGMILKNQHQAGKTWTRDVITFDVSKRGDTTACTAWQNGKIIAVDTEVKQ